MELVAFVEKDYHIKVGPQELVPENFDSINKLSRFITSKMAGAVPAVWRRWPEALGNAPGPPADVTLIRPRRRK